METKKVLGIIFSVLFVGAFIFALTWGIINFNKVKEGMSGTGVYTEQDLNNAYEDGYNTALSDKEGFEKLINSYRDTITTQSDQISQLNSEVSNLRNTNKDYKTQVENLAAQREVLETQVETLNSIKTNNDATISELNRQIDDLNNKLIALQGEKDQYATQIESLNSQIANLQSLNTQLQTTNELNLQTITGLNNQITSLTTQINDLNYQIQNNSTSVNALNNKIAELQKSVSYYEQYIASLESGEQVVATFEFAGSVYNIQVVNKNDIVTVTTPTSTAFVIFNGWTVNGEIVDLSTYQITANTKFVADVTYKYEVNFVVDEENYNSQIVVKDNNATIPADPTKTGYVFDGWTLNNSIVDVENYSIAQNTNFVAKFSKLYSVIFKYEDTTISTQTVKNGNYAQSVETTSTAYKIFNGWKVGNSIVDITTYKIIADTVFVADITYKYDVKFIVEGAEYNSQIIAKNAYATLPEIPTKTNYRFVGWTLNGTDVVDVNNTSITENTIFTAFFVIEKSTVTFKSGDTVIATQQVDKGGFATNPDFASSGFAGWTIDGINVIDLASTPITQDTTFIAKFISQKLEQGVYLFTMDFKYFDSFYQEEFTQKGLNLMIEFDSDGKILGSDEIMFKPQGYSLEVFQINEKDISVTLTSSGVSDNNFYKFTLHFESGIWTCEVIESEHFGSTIEILNFNNYYFATKNSESGALGDAFGYYHYHIVLSDIYNTVIEGAFIRSIDGKVGMFLDYNNSMSIKSYVYEKHDDWTEISVVQDNYGTITYTIQFSWYYGIDVIEVSNSNGEVWDYSQLSGTMDNPTYIEKVYIGW